MAVLSAEFVRGFGVPYIEAMASGTAVVATRIRGAGGARGVATERSYVTKNSAPLCADSSTTRRCGSVTRKSACGAHEILIGTRSAPHMKTSTDERSPTARPSSLAPFTSNGGSQDESARAHADQDAREQRAGSSASIKRDFPSTRRHCSSQAPSRIRGPQCAHGRCPETVCVRRQPSNGLAWR